MEFWWRWWISDIVMFRKLFQLTLRKYTTTLPFFSKDISGPAHACHNSKHIEDEAEADANAPTTKFKPNPPLVFNPATENDNEDVEDELDDSVSSSLVVFRSIRPIKCTDNY